MPCCAFAAAVIGQLLLVVRAVKRLLLGESAEAARNVAVEWRLGGESPPFEAPRRFSLGSRRVLGGLAIAAVLEIALVLGAVYGLVDHFGHGHATHVHGAARGPDRTVPMQEVIP
jgi:hypothetical protein